MTWGLRSIMGLACLLAAGDAAAGPKVSLSTPDGAARIEGELLEYTGAAYRLRTTLGVFTVDADTVDCNGAGCPPPAPPLALPKTDVTLVGPASLRAVAAALLPHSPTADEGVFQLAGLAAGQTLSYTETSAEAATGAVAAGRADLAFGYGPTDGTRLGQTALLVAARPDLGVTEVPRTALLDALNGTLTNWRALGGPDLALVPVLPDEPDLAAQIRATLGAPPASPAERIPAAAFAGLRETRPGAFLIAPATLLPFAKAMTLSDACVGPTKADLFTVRQGRYPFLLSITLEGALPGAVEAQRAARAKAGALTTVAARPILRPLAAAGDGIAAQLARAERRELPTVAAVIGGLQGATAVAADLRFDSGSARLTPALRREVEALSEDLRAVLDPGASLRVIGHADRLESGSTALSLRRAEAIAAALGPGFEIDSQGAAQSLPQGCNTTTKGRAKNRRAEIWILPRAGRSP
ncbi:MAG: OmpA family protein [Pseudomonadota bacterium]